MIALALLVLLIVFVTAYANTRHRSSRRSDPDRVEAVGVGVGAGEPLTRWVEAGLLTAAQAQAIADYEAGTHPARPKPSVPPALEALGYLGGVLVAVGAAMLISQFWDDMGSLGHLSVAATTAVVTGVAGAVVGEAEPVTWRLRGFLWALSSAAVAAVAGLFTSEVLGADDEPVVLAAAGLGALSSVAYWRLEDRPLQHLLAVVGAAVSVGVALSWAGAGGAVVGLTIWALGLGWAALASRDHVPPAPVGFLLGAALTLVAPTIVGSQLEWLAPILGVVTAAGWVVIGVARDELIALAPGLLGVFVFLPWTLGYFFGETVGAPVIAMLSGVLLLVTVVMLFQRRHGPPTATGGPAPATGAAPRAVRGLAAH